MPGTTATTHVRRQPPWLLLGGILLALVSTAVVLHVLWPETPTPRELIEKSFAEEGKVLLHTPYTVGDRIAGVKVTFDRSLLDTHQLYLARPDNREDFLRIDSAGVVSSNVAVTGTLRETGELRITPTRASLFLDGKALPVNLTDWRVHWVASTRTAPEVKKESIPGTWFADSFMRSELENDYCRVVAGRVEMAQRGGGMAETAEELRDYQFQRAVNPFSVRCRDDAVLSFRTGGAWRWGDLHVEARFYFGVPKTGDVVDTDTVPTDTDMLAAIGDPAGRLFAFGWRGNEQAFCLLERSGRRGWTVLARREGPRPAVTDWVKIGLEVQAGHMLAGRLDGATVLTHELGAVPGGEPYIVTGKALVELDDVRVWSAEPDTGGTPICVKSRQFAFKRTKGGSDPPQFREWALSTGAFRKNCWFDPAANRRHASIITALPLIGDFQYTSTSHSPESGPLPDGDYEFVVTRSEAGREPDARGLSPVFSLRARRAADAWVIPKQGGLDSDVRAAVLTLARRADEDGRMCLRVDGKWCPVSGPVRGAALLAIHATRPGSRYLFAPSPNHHEIRCRNLVTEFFEEAPVDWSWVDGSFRMDCRWACENRWNFMACGSPAVPYMTSKRTFGGDQFHEYFASLRGVLPWDAGDKSFQYDAEADAEQRFETHRAHGGWYNRRDVNFSFCSDGRNPLSGYAVVFGANDNSETRLLKRGAVIARTRDPRFLIPKDKSYHSFHWKWWHFSVRKQDRRILVYLNGELMFDYKDSAPIEGGHIGFWSVRNGFILSRVSSMAEAIEWTPDVLYVSDDTPSAWQPLRRDCVTISPVKGDVVRVENTVGGGFFAARFEPEQPVDLAATPVLELPLSPSRGTAVSVHLHIDGESYIVPLKGTSTREVKSLLTPEFEKGEVFQLQTMSKNDMRRRRSLGDARIRGGRLNVDLLQSLRKLGRTSSHPKLTCITVGNTSNEDYALAGNDVNEAGCYYDVGKPVFRAR